MRKPPPAASETRNPADRETGDIYVPSIYSGVWHSPGFGLFGSPRYDPGLSVVGPVPVSSWIEGMARD